MRPTKRVYDIRALYGDGITWVLRHNTLIGALFYLWRDLRGRNPRDPRYPEPVLRYEIVAQPETRVTGFDPVRGSFHLRDAEQVWPDAEPHSLELQTDRLQKVLEAVQAQDDTQDLELRTKPYLQDPDPTTPPGEGLIYATTTRGDGNTLKWTMVGVLAIVVIAGAVRLAVLFFGAA